MSNFPEDVVIEQRVTPLLEAQQAIRERHATEKSKAREKADQLEKQITQATFNWVCGSGNERQVEDLLADKQIADALIQALDEPVIADTIRRWRCRIDGVFVDRDRIKKARAKIQELQQQMDEAIPRDKEGIEARMRDQSVYIVQRQRELERRVEQLPAIPGAKLPRAAA